MDREQVQVGVREALRRWAEVNAGVRAEVPELSSGAESLIVDLVVNIEKDPSPYWAWDLENMDVVQRFAITSLPNILLDMQASYGFRRRWPLQKVSSWEVLHQISGALDKWCPIPKDV